MAVKIRQRSGTWWLGAIVLLLAPPASAIVKCRTADGNVIIADVAPPGCVVETELQPNAPAESADDEPPVDDSHRSAVMAEAIAKRRVLERRADDIGKSLRRLRQQIDSVPPEPATLQFFETESAVAYYETRRRQEKLLAGWLEEKTMLERRLEELTDEYAALTDAVTTAHGGEKPASWPMRLRCRECAER